MIVAAAADGGLLDVHDRRPIVLSATDVTLWMKLDLLPDEAAHMLAAFASPVEPAKSGLRVCWRLFQAYAGMLLTSRKRPSYNCGAKNLLRTADWLVGYSGLS